MAIEAPLSKFSKNGFKIYIGVCLVFAVVFAYDGYLSKYEWSQRHSFYKEHVLDNDGVADEIMLFNRYSPFALLALAAGLGFRFFMVKDRKVVAGETDLVIDGKQSVPYERIEQIDKTHFEKKGYFVLTYKNEQDSDTDLKLSDRVYDNLGAILEDIVARIS